MKSFSLGIIRILLIIVTQITRSLLNPKRLPILPFCHSLQFCWKLIKLPTRILIHQAFVPHFANRTLYVKSLMAPFCVMLDWISCVCSGRVFRTTSHRLTHRMRRDQFSRGAAQKMSDCAAIRLIQLAPEPTLQL